MALRALSLYRQSLRLAKRCADPSQRSTWETHIREEFRRNSTLFGDKQRWALDEVSERLSFQRRMLSSSDERDAAKNSMARGEYEYKSSRAEQPTAVGSMRDAFALEPGGSIAENMMERWGVVVVVVVVVLLLLLTVPPPPSPITISGSKLEAPGANAAPPWVADADNFKKLARAMAAAEPSLKDRLRELKEARDEGLLDDEEWKAAKAKLL